MFGSIPGDFRELASQTAAKIAIKIKTAPITVIFMALPSTV